MEIAGLRVPGAAQHGAKRNGALQTRDPGFLLAEQPGSRISGAPLRHKRVTALTASRCTASGTRGVTPDF
jgi:hypothetical protein